MIAKSLLIVIVAALSPIAMAQEATEQRPEPREIQTRTVTYEKDGVTFHGYLARPREVTGEVPGVLVIHEWWGLNEFAKKQTRRLAELGYVAFAADMYGEGRTTTDPQHASQWAGELYANRMLMRERAEEALDKLEDMPNVDDDRLGVIGFCFGGTAAVELGYEEDDVKAVVSFHGNPMPARSEDDDIEARFLILHGTADTLVPEERLANFSEALNRHEANYRIIRYEGAKHSFTNPAADALGMDGVGYDEATARQSWQDMHAFFKQVFGE